MRGLDYYNLTVFEWVTDGLTVCGGGRYDPLVEMLGGRAAPACGFAIGVERVLELMRRAGEQIDDSQGDVYIVHQGDAAQLAAFQAAERLRDAGIDVVLHCGGGGFKAQFRRADASGAFLAVVLGEDELAAGEATLKWLRGERGAVGAGRQERVALATLPETVIDAITAGGEDRAGRGARGNDRTCASASCARALTATERGASGDGLRLGRAGTDRSPQGILGDATATSS